MKKLSPYIPITKVRRFTAFLVKRNKDIAAKIISGGIKEVEVVEDKIILREKRRGKAVKRYKSSGEPGGYRFLEIRKKERGLMMRMIRKVKKFVKHTLKHITMKDTTYKRLVPLVQMDPVSFEKSRKERTNREQSIGRE